MMKKILICICMVISFTTVIKVNAQVNVEGLLDVIYRNAETADITNETFRGFSNFHSSRTRLFFDAAPAENVEVFTQILIDNYTFQLYGGYVRFTDIGLFNLNAQFGLIPMPVGSWGPRTYSNKNPLIGVPLLYNMHSSYIPGGEIQVHTVDDILTVRDNRSKFGLPVLYDACWNVGAEFYGSSGKLHYSIGLLTGALSKPTSEQSKNIPQFTTHVTYDLNSRITIGGSAFMGPYLMEGAYNDTIPTGTKFSDFMSKGVGYEFHFDGRYLDIYSEGFYTSWEHPYLEDLNLKAGYIEGKYKFVPGWFFAGRYGIYQPEKLKDSNGDLQNWDYPVTRIEYGIGYHPNRKTTLKFVNQINRFDFTNQFDNELYAFQLSVLFN